MRLILLPGMDGTGKLFHRFQKALPDEYSTTVISYPSDRTLDWAHLQRLVLKNLPSEEPFALLGESFSGPIAYSIASRRPSNLKALILCATFLSNPTSAFIHWIRPILAPIVFRQSLPAVVARKIIVGGDASDDLVSEIQQLAPTVTPEVWNFRAKLITSLKPTDFEPLSKLPLLYLQAAQDRLVPSRCASEIRALAPQIKVKVFQSAHLILQSRPQEAATCIADFLAPLLHLGDTRKNE